MRFSMLRVISVGVVRRNLYRTYQDAVTIIIQELTVPIVYILLWLEYNYHHALQLSKVPRGLISEKTYSQEHLTFL